MEINLNKTCRICLKEGEDFKSIFYSDDFPSQQVSVSSKIMACSSVQITAGDGLPEVICSDCLTQVDVAYDFKEKCQNSDATLRKYVSLVKPYFPFTEISEQVIKLEEPVVVKNELAEPEEASVNVYTFNEPSNSSQEAKSDKLTETKVPIPVTPKKKSQEKTESKPRRGRGSKKNQEEETATDCEKKKKNKEKDLECPICKKTFAYLCILRDHMVQHTGAKPYLCSVCGKSFGHTASLTNHMKTHYSDKPYKCERCELGFHRQAHLVLHMRTHTGEKPFVCDVCGRDFAQSSYLKEHMRLHSGEKPFVCDICGHGFARKSCLVMHRRVHTGELPYSCPECGRAFSQRSQRKRHVKRNHKGSACLRATGELILRDHDLKKKQFPREDMNSEMITSENFLTENALEIKEENSMVDRDAGTVFLPEFQPTTSVESPVALYKQENMSPLYLSTVMPLPLVQVQTTLLQ